ncbi:MAG: FkbM family methyltransferase [Ruminococcus sp.]|nr:FkbM family methyltransferase [Ruminococcus sp.]
MGDGGEKMLKWCEKYGITPAGFFASDDFVRGQSFHGKAVITLSQVEQLYGRVCVLLGFGTDLPEVMARIDEIEKRHLLLAPDVSAIGSDIFDRSEFFSMFGDAEKAFDLLSDDLSRRTFTSLCAYKLTGELSFLRAVFSDDSQLLDLIDPTPGETYVDLGAYNGDTVLSFIGRAGECRHIYAVEPEKRNFQKCLKNLRSLDDITLVNAAAWDRSCRLGFDSGSGRMAQISPFGRSTTAAVSVDELLRGKPCTTIKYDVEGADIEALNGSARTIASFRPKLLCAAYHRCYDFVRVPLHIAAIADGYSFYLRQSRYYPAWETNYVAKV